MSDSEEVDIEKYKSECWRCEGEGKLESDKNACHHCGGKGHIIHVYPGRPKIRADDFPETIDSDVRSIGNGKLHEGRNR